MTIARKAICIGMTVWFLVVVGTGGLMSVPGVRAITIQQEEELSREIMAKIKQQLPLLNDPMIVEYVDGLGRKILAELPPQPFRYQFYVIDSPVLNAFATPAGHIFFHTGLIIAMDSEAELAGIMAHEIAHVTCRHISGKIDASKKVQISSLAGLAAGLLLGAVTGSGEVAQAATMGAMAGGQSAMLAYSREDEIQADQLGMDYLHLSGYSGKGLLQALVKIRSQQWFGSDQVPTYLSTHPASEDRLAYLGSRIDAGEPPRVATVTAKGPTAFDWARARALALYGDRDAAHNTFEQALAADPKDAVAHYGMGLSLARAEQWGSAETHLKTALGRNAFNPHMLTDLGRVYFHTGDYARARQSLKSALGMAPQNQLALFYLGRTFLELDLPGEAVTVLEPLAGKSVKDPKVFYFLGNSYNRLGQPAEAHYYLGSFYFASGKWAQARKQFELALAAGLDGERAEKVKKNLENARQSQSRKAPPS